MNSDIAPSISQTDLNEMYLYERYSFLKKCEQKIDRLKKQNEKEVQQIKQQEQEMQNMRSNLPNIQPIK